MRTPANLAESLDLALEVADLGSWDVDLATGVAVWNRRHASMQGYPPDLAAPTLQHWQRLVHADDRALVASAYERACRERSLFAIEHRLCRADTGEVRWLALRGRFLYDADGRAARLMGVSFDITDRKRADERVRESEMRFRHMANHAPVAIWITEPDGSCTFLNDRWYEWTGQTPATGLGTGWLDAVHPEDRAGAAAEFMAATAQQRPFQLEYRLRRHDGAYRWAIDAAAPRRSADGEFLGFIGSVLDITDRKAVEEELRRRQGELQTMLDLLPVGVGIAHDPAAREITVSPALAKLLRVEDPAQNVSKTGQARDRLLYRCLRDGVEVADEDLPMQRACLLATDVRDDELDLVFPDGTRITLMISASPLFDEVGKVRGAIATHVDITSLKQVQRALEHADRQKDEFLAMLAHELRNPLAPIRNAAELLARLPLGNEAARTATSMIERQVTHLTRLVDDLLDVSRITRGRIELHREFIDLSDVIADAVETVQPLLQARGHRLEVVLSHPGLVVWGDRARLLQCVVNLLTNAAKYTEDGGRIQVRAASSGDSASIEVADSGMGIEPDLLPHVFELFVQGERGLARSQGGLGIGLSVVRSLAELHGGSVTARSDGAGRGATFTLQLPRAVRPPAQHRLPLSGSAPRRRILVVDDNADAANSLALVLQLDGHEARTVYSGREAVELVDAFAADVVLLDIGLPEIDGYEVARRIRSRVTRPVRLVAVSGYGRDDDRRRADHAGFDAYLVKPLVFETLERALGG